MNLTDSLEKHSMLVTNAAIQQWESVINTPAVQNALKTTTVGGAKAMAYKGNFYGLLNNELHIGPLHWYLTMRVNGLCTPTEYDGFTDITIIDSELVDNIISLIEDA